MPFLLLMPSYNQAHYIREAVDSVLAQDDPDWELWILDNSTDETPEVMAVCSDPRIHFIHEPTRMDPGTCLNVMLKMAKGDFFSYIHTDNRLCPNYVRSFRQALKVHPMALAYCDQYEIDARGAGRILRKRPKSFSSSRLFSQDSLGVPFSATTALAEALGGFSADDLADDVFFAMRADGLGPRIHIPEPLVEYRLHGQSRTEILGFHGVAQSIYVSALRAYGLRSRELPDPFIDMEHRIRSHAGKASRQALILARALLKRVPKDSEVWIEGTGPASFWLAWGCAELGRKPLGFRAQRDDRPLLGLPVISVESRLPSGAVCLRPRRKGPDPEAIRQDWIQPLRWVLRGLPPQDHLIKRYPADIMCSLLIPLHHHSPGEAPVWVYGGDALAAYLAYGIETLACLPFGGWVGVSPVALGNHPTVTRPPDGARLWVPPGSIATQGVLWTPSR